MAATVMALARHYGDDEDPEKRKKFDITGMWLRMDLGEQKARRAAGQSPLSIVVDGKYYPYKNQPMAGALVLIGNLRDADRQNGVP